MFIREPTRARAVDEETGYSVVHLLQMYCGIYYRPISNLGFLSKVVEKVVDARLAEHVNLHRLLPVVQSAYRPFHSTETAILRVLNDMIGVVDQGHIGALMLLDLSAAFDTVDHSILMEVLRRLFGVEGNALGWLTEFLPERSQVDRVGESEFDSLPLHFGVLQGSVLGPKRFIRYTEDVDDLFVRHSMRHHLFTDDMQGFRSADPSDISVIVTGVEDCVADVSSWSAAKRLHAAKRH